MLIESLVKATVELQGFRVMHVAGNADGLVATLGPDRRYAPRCGRCQEPAPYRDTRRIRHFRHVPIWGVSVALRYAPRRVSCSRCAGVRVESMPWVSGKQRMTRALMVTLATWTRVLALGSKWRGCSIALGAQWPLRSMRRWPTGSRIVTSKG